MAAVSATFTAIILPAVSTYFLVGLAVAAGEGNLSTTSPFLRIGLLTVGATAGVTGWISTVGLRHGGADSNSQLRSGSARYRK